MKTKHNLATLAQPETISRALAMATPRPKRSPSAQSLPAWIELSVLSSRVRTWESDVMARLATAPFSLSLLPLGKQPTTSTISDE